MPLMLDSLSAVALEALPRDQTVFFFAVGPLEDHGPHLPLGLDVRESAELARLAAERLEREKPGWTAVLMPAVPLGIDSNTTALAVTVRGHVLRDWLVDACISLHRRGFRQFACFSGHLGPKQLTAIEEAGKFVRHRTGGSLLMRWLRPGHKPAVLVSASSPLADPRAVRASPLWPNPSEHGGERDTSVALALLPDGVDRSHETLPSLPKQGSSWVRRWKHRRRTLSGYWGAPSRGSVSIGKETLKDQLDQVFPKLRAVWEGANPESLFRSWYSLFPSNRSFFKAWVLATALGALLGLWVYLTIQGTLNS